MIFNWHNKGGDMLKKLYLLLIILFISFVSILHANEKEIVITGEGAILSSATGKLTKSYPFVLVHLDHFSMEANPLYQDKYPTIKVKQFRIGLAHFEKQDSNVHYDKWSNYYTMNKFLSVGKTMLFDNIDMVIPIDGLNNLKGYWVTIETEIDRRGSVSSVYSYSQKDIFE